MNNTILIEKIKENKLIKILLNGHERSVNIKKNILGSFFLRGISIIISFIQVPFTLHYLNTTKYGIWVTLGSIISWFQFFDVGLGNGLRNKFAEALAKNDKVLARNYVSTAYFIITVIGIIIILLFLVINPFLDWVKILNTERDWQNELNILVYFVFFSFSIRFVFQLIGTILVSDQKPAIREVMHVGSSLLTLAIIIVLTKTTEGSLLYLGICFSFVPIIIYFFTSIYFYSRNYKDYLPSFKYVNMKYARDLTSLGIKFFIIQISAVILFSTNNIIITQVVGPAEVTPYNIAYKYFSTITMIFMIIATPFWSGFTDAYFRNEIGWIKRSMKQLKKITIFFIIVTLLMLLISSSFFKLWIGRSVTVPFILSFYSALNVIIMTWGTPYIFFINGVGKIKLQLIIGIFFAVINIPLCLILAKNFNMGSAGVVLASCICNLPALVLWPLQYKKIINNKANGIWAG